MNKSTARETGLFNRSNISSLDRKDMNARIYNEITKICKDYHSIGIYVSKEHEVDTFSVIEWCFKNQKKVFVPKVTGNDLEFYQISSFNDLKKGYFNILEPCTKKIGSADEIEIMLIPLVALDHEGNRVGYGRGFYDRFLKEVHRKIGLCYECQIFDRIEADDFDVRLNAYISEKGYFNIK